MRLAFVNDTDGRENIGCRLTSGCAKALLDEQAEALGISLDLVSCPWLFRKAPVPFLPAFSLSILMGNSPLGRQSLLELCLLEYGSEAVAIVETADAVVYQPEGSISDNHSSLRVLRQLSLPLYASLHLNKPLGVFNGTFPLFKDKRRSLIETFIGQAVSASLRDRLSAEYYSCGFAPDAAIFWKGAVAADNLKRDHVLITTAAHTTLDRDRELAAAALDFCEKQKLKPLVLTKAWERLIGFQSQVEALGGTFCKYATLAEADTLLSRCRLHIGGRYHMALFCLTKGIPSWLVLSNTHKNLWLAREFPGITILDMAKANFLTEVDPNNIMKKDEMLAHVKKLRTTSSQCARNLLESFSRFQLSQKRLPSDTVKMTWGKKEITAEIRREHLRSCGKSLIRALQPDRAIQGEFVASSSFEDVKKRKTKTGEF